MQIPASAAGRNGLRGDAGALLAATQAAREHAASRPKPAVELGSTGLSRHSTGTSGNGLGGLQGAGPSSRPASGGGQSHTDNFVTQRLSELHTGRTGTTLLSPPSGKSAANGTRQGTTSPSLIAATLAASRPISPIRGLSSESNLSSGWLTHRRGQSVGSAGIMPTSAGLSMNHGKRTDQAEALDTASIPPTTSLVSLFESKKGEHDTVDPVKRRVPPLGLRDPTANGQDRMDGPQQQLRMVKPKPKPTPKPKPKPRLSAGLERLEPSEEPDESSRRLSQLEYPRSNDNGDDGNRECLFIADSPQQTHSGSQNSGKPTVQPKHHPNKRPSTPSSPAFARILSSQNLPQPAKPVKTPVLGPPVPPVRRSNTIKMTGPHAQDAPVRSAEPETDAFRMPERDVPAPRRSSHSSVSSNDTFVSASSMQSRPTSMVEEATNPPRRPTAPARSSSLRSISIPDLQRARAQQTPTRNLTLNSLTNAIVASNLASARLTPSQPPPPPPGMLLPTLRGPQHSLSDDEDARRRRTQPRHHYHPRRVVAGGGRKHAHHEGSRRRWRDEITPRERRRYEAVWASNRGLFLKPGWRVPFLPPPPPTPHDSSSSGGISGDGRRESERMQMQRVIEASRPADGTPEADLVVNMVVRDIWSRSRLPADELAEVWELVDRQRRGALGKEEFVVGMWLIDQRLKGRKIPTRVGQSVWDSAGGGHGLVVPVPGAGKGKRR
ncbi:hypothetical protein N658DRAFT_512200 [Parathielavia hyrcaniae]|uniref:EH domain-containing protein n=1 Tax=Parathielavia hyrcaniae TaxID=113614 RepID=A0AAN6T5V7_9PEZI|nr:hypothetical protein N658DRAFT_512200 [Parathielavia hyrcaniae]